MARTVGGLASARSRVALGIILTSGLGATGQAQAADSTRNPSLIGAGLAMPLGQNVDKSFSAITLHSTSLRPNRLGLDFTLALFPRIIAHGALGGGARVNLGVPLVIGRQTLLIPSAGLTALGAIGSGGGGGVVGYNGSVALLAFGAPLDEAESRYGLRLGVSLHRIGGSGDGALRIVEIGVVRLLR